MNNSQDTTNLAMIEKVVMTMDKDYSKASLEVAEITIFQEVVTETEKEEIAEEIILTRETEVNLQ